MNMDFNRKEGSYNIVKDKLNNTETETWVTDDGEHSDVIKITYKNEYRCEYTTTLKNGDKYMRNINHLKGSDIPSYVIIKQEIPRFVNTFNERWETVEEEEPIIEVKKKLIGRPPNPKPDVVVKVKAVGRPALRSPEEAKSRKQLLQQIRFKMNKNDNNTIRKEDYIDKTNNELIEYIKTLL